MQSHLRAIGLSRHRQGVHRSTKDVLIPTTGFLIIPVPSQRNQAFGGTSSTVDIWSKGGGRICAMHENVNNVNMLLFWPGLLADKIISTDADRYEVLCLKVRSSTLKSCLPTASRNGKYFCLSFNNT